MRLLLANALLLGALIWATLSDTGDLGGGIPSEPATLAAAIIENEAAILTPDIAEPDDASAEDGNPDHVGQEDPGSDVTVVPDAPSGAFPEPERESAPAPEMKPAEIPAAPSTAASETTELEPEVDRGSDTEQAGSPVGTVSPSVAILDRVALEELAEELEAVFLKLQP